MNYLDMCTKPVACQDNNSNDVGFFSLTELRRKGLL